jgi:hypothetical protein
MAEIKEELIKLQTTKQMAEDNIWNSLQKLMKIIKGEYNGKIEINDIEIWPEGINFIGSYSCDFSYWSHFIEWDMVYSKLDLNKEET